MSTGLGNGPTLQRIQEWEPSCSLDSSLSRSLPRSDNNRKPFNFLSQHPTKALDLAKQRHDSKSGVHCLQLVLRCTRTCLPITVHKKFQQQQQLPNTLPSLRRLRQQEVPSASTSAPSLGLRIRLPCKGYTVALPSAGLRGTLSRWIWLIVFLMLFPHTPAVPTHSKSLSLYSSPLLVGGSWHGDHLFSTTTMPGTQWRGPLSH